MGHLFDHIIRRVENEIDLYLRASKEMCKEKKKKRKKKQTCSKEIVAKDSRNKRSKEIWKMRDASLRERTIV